MKIMLAVSSMRSGGAERVAATLANAWTAAGHHVTLVATYSGRSECFYKLAHSVRLVFLADRVLTSRRNPLAHFARLRAMRQLVKACEPDVVVSFLTNVNVFTILATHALPVPVVICEHTNPLADGRSCLWALLARFVYPRAAVVTLLTASVVEPFRKQLPAIRRLAVVPNPLPDELFDLPPVRTEADSRKRLVSVGRLEAVKQFDHLIEAFSTVASTNPEWDLWIWGEGSQRAQLASLVAQRGLTQRVFLPGQTTQPWVRMLEGDAYALSSRHEGLPMALMEAMGLGLPVLAYDCPSGPRELTRDGQDGLLARPNDVAHLAQQLQCLFNGVQLRNALGARAAASIRERYALEPVLKIWTNLFASLGVNSKQQGRGVQAATYNGD